VLLLAVPFNGKSGCRPTLMECLRATPERMMIDTEN
jgi:hypothetical protein